jgi:bacterioferritin-associated ferredoxin
VIRRHPDIKLTRQEGDIAALASLQGELRCGTNCGSCLPALRGLVQRHGALEPTA